MSSSVNWVPVILMFVLPLLLGVGGLVLARRFRPLWARILSRVFGAGLLAIFLFVLSVMTPYWWALHLESKWVPAHPKTRAELESHLSLYSQHEIPAAKSPWGKNRPIESGERIVEYDLLYLAPLDVIYTTNDTIAQIYTAYE